MKSALVQHLPHCVHGFVKVIPAHVSGQPRAFVRPLAGQPQDACSLSVSVLRLDLHERATKGDEGRSASI
jgi:hypothetical protein